MAVISFSIAASAFDTQLIPEGARQVGTPAFRDAVSAFLAEQFKGFGGHAKFRVDDQTVAALWDPDSQRPDPIAFIVQKLRNGKTAEGIQLLELLLSNRPEDPAVLYNLGLALSDAGRLERAEECLRRATDLDPREVNIAVALGVVLGRMGREDEAIAVLRAAVSQDDGNPWARRNLGALLLRAGRSEHAIPHFLAATRLLADDQLSWVGLADALRLARHPKDAEPAYRRAVEINPHSELAEKARTGSNLLAQATFDRSKPAIPREDAIRHCLEALKLLAPMPQDELQKVTLEIALAGRDGFAVHNPEKRYQIKALGGEFSGLAMVCFLYVGMQRMAPGTDIGFDLAAEYAEARKLFTATR